MKYKRLGRTGLKISELCLGTMQFGWSVNAKDSYNILSETWSRGINFIDTADMYSNWVEGNPGGVSEEIVGQWHSSNKIPRDQLIIATKVRGKMGEDPNNIGLSRQHIMHSVEQSLKRLKTDYIDLYQTHSTDPDTPIEETLRALDDLVHQGKVRYIGCSNYPAWQLMEALWTSDSQGLYRFDSLQPNYSLVFRKQFEQGNESVCKKYGIGVIPYSPLAGGFLTGKYRRNKPLPNSIRASAVQDRHIKEKNWETLKVVGDVAKSHNASMSQIALAWLLHRPVITSPIIGPRDVQQLQDNLGTIDILLSNHDMTILNEISAWQD
ncbi:MAG: aldo/keto reductase [Candidatus Marinimicrobia bacterium]|nr:aldo/keto reductase [Candidatus Neomarinimicrobiota bacterium]